MATLASVVLGIFCSVTTIAFAGGIASAIALSAAFTAFGLMFAGVAAITGLVFPFLLTRLKVMGIIVAIARLIQSRHQSP